jgi:hypothetical protein
MKTSQVTISHFLPFSSHLLLVLTILKNLFKTEKILWYNFLAGTRRV